MLYHKDIGFPETLDWIDQTRMFLQYTKHAVNAALSDRYGAIALPDTVCFMKHRVIEVETSDDIHIDKALLQVPYINDLKLSMVIIMDGMRVKTVWLNHISDIHTTLDKSKYDIPKSCLDRILQLIKN